MKYLSLLVLALFAAPAFSKDRPRHTAMSFFSADNAYFQYTGRIDFSSPKLPRFWSPGVYIKARFKGTECELLINDEELNGDTHNYIEIAIDNEPPRRMQTSGKTNVIRVAQKLTNTVHTIIITKDTESGIGYLEFSGLKCAQLLPPPAKPERKIEYIGDSITAGAGMDLSVVPCDKGKWYDQHNAYMSYGALTSRALNAQWQITAVAGIGLIHSCCNMNIVMPQVFDKVLMRQDSINWDFNKYRPDVVTICLGQNDGIQDSTVFCGAYVRLIHQVRRRYPQATIICMTSPMGDDKLTSVLKKYLAGIIDQVNISGDKNAYKFYFSKRYDHGCGTHPDLAEHQQIAAELTGYIRQVKHW
jgi:hypothetical protein